MVNLPHFSMRFASSCLAILLVLIVVESGVPCRISAQQPELENAATAIGNKLLKEKRTRILVTDFYGPDKRELTEMGRDLAGRFSEALSKASPNFVLLPRSGLTSKVPIFTQPMIIEVPQTLPMFPETFAESNAAHILAWGAEADTIVVGRLKRSSSGIQLELHVYLPPVATVPSAGDTPGSDVAQPWTHEAKIKFPMTNELRAEFDHVLSDSQKDSFVLTAGADNSNESLLKSECVDCPLISFELSVVLNVMLSVQANGGVKVDSVSLQKPQQDEGKSTHLSEMETDGMTGHVIETVTKWRFKTFTPLHGHEPELHRLLVVDGVHRTLVLYPRGAAYLSSVRGKSGIHIESPGNN
ncbi:MAG TPA: hypothetical protein VFI38_09435 [Candidatus Acidoferrum sp.]|nr:hypothetical protein [Candidatus Acidoferrum sp.]